MMPHDAEFRNPIIDRSSPKHATKAPEVYACGEGAILDGRLSNCTAIGIFLRHLLHVTSRWEERERREPRQEEDQ
jgi:hypothetical protein